MNSKEIARRIGLVFIVFGGLWIVSCLLLEVTTRWYSTGAGSLGIGIGIWYLKK